jgi:hypothetical protein
MLDTDHLWGVGGDVPWVWKSFLRGENPIWMDSFDQASVWEPMPANAEAVRKNLGYARGFAERIDLKKVHPHAELSSSSYCLANPGVEYLVYQPAPGKAVAVEVKAGTYHYEWFNPATGVTTGSGRIETAGASQEFRAPFAQDAVLYLKRQKQE